MRKVRIVETGEVFDSLSDCARHIDGKVENVYKCLSGRCRKYRGFSFEYADLSMSYLKLGRAIKNSLVDKESFDEINFVEEMNKNNDPTLRF